MQKVMKRGCWSCWLNKQDRAVSFNFYALNLVHFMFTSRFFHSFGTSSAEGNNWNYPQNDAKQQKEPGGPTGEQRNHHTLNRSCFKRNSFPLHSSPQSTHRKHKTHRTQNFTTARTSLQQQKPAQLLQPWHGEGWGEQQQLNAWPNLTGLLAMTKQ